MSTVAIIGYGKSGQAAHKVLEKLGHKDVEIYDDKLEGCRAVSTYTGGYDITVLSPGIALSMLSSAPSSVMSEIELAHGLKNKDAKVIVITGTNGKSTVTYLIAQILRNLGINAKACGNIGTTYADTVLNDPADIYVLELSSFQIELLKDFKVDAAVVTNITPDHLDRYADMAEYTEAKLKVFEHVHAEGAVVVPDDGLISKRAEQYLFGRIVLDESLEMYRKEEKIYELGEFRFNAENFPLFGSHNLLNLVFSLCAVDIVAPLSGDVDSIISNLEGLEHRCEYAGTAGGIRYINDSKATNVYSTLAALNGAEPGLTLMLGGKDKKGDFRLLVDRINEKVKKLYLFGAAADVIEAQLVGYVNTEIVKISTMKEAVTHSFKNGSKGDVVLLSPACASFDEFRGFEERGAVFKDMVKKLEN